MLRREFAHHQGGIGGLIWTQAASLDERVQFFDQRLFRRTKPDVAVVLDERMISTAQEAGRI